MRRAFVICVCLAAAPLACDPHMGVRGSVSTTPTGVAGSAKPYDSEKPLEGAAVSMTCGTGEPVFMRRTDADGGFDWGRVGMLSDECTVAIEKDGYHPQTIPIAPLCGQHVDCHVAVVRGELAPVASTVPGPAPSLSASAAAAPRADSRVQVRFDARSRHRMIHIIKGPLAADSSGQALCLATCEARLEPGVYELAVSKPGMAPVLPSTRVDLSTPTLVTVSDYEPSRGKWAYNLLTVGALALVGSLFAYSAMDEDSKLRLPVALSAGAFGMTAIIVSEWLKSDKPLMYSTPEPRR